MTAVFTATGEVVMVKVAVEDPAAIVTLAGTRAAFVLLLCNVTTAPPLGAPRVKVSVPVELAPPIRDVGLRVTEDREAGGVMVRVAVRLTPRVPVITEVVSAVTAIEVTANVADVLPAATVTALGTWATVGLPLPSATLIPPVGAAPVRVTVPVELVPPTIDVGFSDNAEMVGAFTVSVAPWLTP